MSRNSFIREIVAALLLLSSLAAAPAVAVIDPAGGFGGGPVSGTLTVKVINELTGAAVPGAYCQVGMLPGLPFAGNGALTNASGVVTFTNAALVGPQTVTAGKSGYACFTAYDVNAREMIVPIRKQGEEIARPTYDGDISGFQITWNDGIVDVALVWRTFFVRELVSFATDILGGNIDRFAPTIGENFPLVGLQPVPGAIYLPLQLELGLVPLSRKPYVIYVEDQSTTDISAVYAKMPIMTLLNELAKPKPDLVAILRDFDIRKYALEEGIEVDGSGSQDLTLDIGEGPRIFLHADNVASDMKLLAVGIADLDGLSGFGRLMPCSFAGTPGDADTVLGLSTLGSGAPGGLDYLAGALQTDTLEELASTAIFDRSGLSAGDTVDATEYLRVPVPDLAGDRFTWTSVANPGAGLFPEVHRVAISLVTTIPDTNAWAEPGDTLDVPTVLWNFVLGGEDTSFVLPCLGTALASPVVDPAGTPDQDRLDWSVTGVGLGLAPSFDYDDWDLVDLGLYGTHLASNTEKFVAPPGTPFTDVAFPGSAPDEAALGQARPNPFRDRTAVRFGLGSPREEARLGVYDVAGRRVRTIYAGAGAGPREATWDGTDDRGIPVPSGIYLLRLTAGERTLTRKVVKTR